MDFSELDPLAAWATVELRHLRAFLAVAEERHFGRAAARLNVSQPTVSRLLRELETALDVRLLERNSRQVELTAAGRGLSSRVRDVLRDLRRALATTTSAGRADARTLALGCLNAAGRELLAPLRVALADAAEPWSIREESVSIRSGFDDIFDGRLDAGFYYLPLSMPEGLEYEVVGEVPQEGAIAATDPLAARKRCSFREFASQPVFLFDMHPVWVANLNVLYRAHGMAPRFAHASATIRETLTRVARGEGRLVAASGSDFFETKGVTWLPISDLERIRVALVWRTDAPPPAVLLDAVRRLALAAPA